MTDCLSCRLIKMTVKHPNVSCMEWIFSDFFFQKCIKKIVFKRIRTGLPNCYIILQFKVCMYTSLYYSILIRNDKNLFITVHYIQLSSDIKQTRHANLILCTSHSDSSKQYLLKLSRKKTDCAIRNLSVCSRKIYNDN